MELISLQAFKRHIEHQEYTLAKLAKKAGVSKATVAHIHRGARTTTTPKTAKAIEKALGLPPCTLFLPRVEPVKRSTEQSGRAA